VSGFAARKKTWKFDLHAREARMKIKFPIFLVHRWCAAQDTIRQCLEIHFIL
jgi:hypothetical protein